MGCAGVRAVWEPGLCRSLSYELCGSLGCVGVQAVWVSGLYPISELLRCLGYAYCMAEEKQVGGSVRATCGQTSFQGAECREVGAGRGGKGLEEHPIQGRLWDGGSGGHCSLSLEHSTLPPALTCNSTS